MTTRSGMGDALFQAEKALTDPAVRRSRSRVEALLHPQFTEIGSSGEIYDRERMIRMMIAEAPGGEVTMRDFAARMLAEDVALVTYRSVGTTGQEARRTSIWMRSDDRWQLRHHHGTRVPGRWDLRR